jgi:hypothetical protein
MKLLLKSLKLPDTATEQDAIAKINSDSAIALEKHKELLEKYNTLLSTSKKSKEDELIALAEKAKAIFDLPEVDYWILSDGNIFDDEIKLLNAKKENHCYQIKVIDREKKQVELALIVI